MNDEMQTWFDGLTVRTRSFVDGHWDVLRYCDGCQEPITIPTDKNIEQWILVHYPHHTTVSDPESVSESINQIARSAAEAFTEQMFTNGDGEKAWRLQLMSDMDVEQNLGGWGKLPFRDLAFGAIRDAIQSAGGEAKLSQIEIFEALKKMRSRGKLKDEYYQVMLVVLRDIFDAKASVKGESR